MKGSNDKEHRAALKDRIGKYLKKEGISLNELSLNAHIPYSSLHGCFKGNAVPSLDTLFKLAKEMGVSCDYLIGLSDDPSRNPAAVDELGLSDKVVNRLKEYNQGIYKASEQGHYWKRFIEKVILNSSFSGIAAAYQELCVYQEEYKQLADIDTNTVKNWSDDIWLKHYKKIGFTMGDFVTLGELGFNQLDSYKTLLSDKIKQKEFEILFEISRAIEQ